MSFFKKWLFWLEQAGALGVLAISIVLGLISFSSHQTRTTLGKFKLFCQRSNYRTERTGTYGMVQSVQVLNFAPYCYFATPKVTRQCSFIKEIRWTRRINGTIVFPRIINRQVLSGWGRIQYESAIYDMSDFRSREMTNVGNFKDEQNGLRFALDGLNLNKFNYQPSPFGLLEQMKLAIRKVDENASEKSYEESPPSLCTSPSLIQALHNSRLYLVIVTGLTALWLGLLLAGSILIVDPGRPVGALLVFCGWAVMWLLGNFIFF